MYATYHPDFQAKVLDYYHVLGLVIADVLPSLGMSSSAISSSHGAVVVLCSLPTVPFLH